MTAKMINGFQTDKCILFLVFHLFISLSIQILCCLPPKGRHFDHETLGAEALDKTL